jgi:hypothetical protein
VSSDTENSETSPAEADIAGKGPARGDLGFSVGAGGVAAVPHEEADSTGKGPARGEAGDAEGLTTWSRTPGRAAPPVDSPASVAVDARGELLPPWILRLAWPLRQ